MLQIAYLANILILIPVCFMMFFGTNGPRVQAFNNTITDSPGLRLLAGSLWFGILSCSCAGLFYPTLFAPILLLQVIYKSTFLLAYVLPLVLKCAWNQVPWGITLSFILIILIWPLLLLYFW